MSHEHHDVDELLDRAASQIEHAQADDETVQRAAARVWERLSGDTAEAAAHAAEVEQIRGCDDYQALLPAYLAGALPEARKLLLEDHTRECVPCRRALKQAREGKTVERSAAKPAAAPASGFGWQRWAMAAALLLGVFGAQYLVREMLPYGGRSAVVQNIDGDLFRVATTSHVPIAVGDTIEEGDVVRTGRAGSAVVRLDDGSLVEIRQRSELSIDESRSGTTIELDRGSVIVEAAKQRDRHLYVSTDDCLVAVTGTIFTVNTGTKGSRVSVIEGEVKVNHSGDESVLRPGDQVVTHVSLGALPVADEIGWSRSVDHYLDVLSQYADLKRDLRRQVPRPGLRTASRLLDLAPQNTVLYAAVPNLSETVSETHRVIRQHMEQNPELGEWWRSHGAHQLGPQVDEIVGKFAELGEYLGEELVVSGQTTGPEQFEGPLVLADIVDAAGIRDMIERELEGALLEGDVEGHVIFVDDPANPPAGEGIFLWLSDNLLVGSPKAHQITAVAAILEGGSNPFTETDFYASIAELYAEGVGILVAADLEGLMASAVTGERAEEAEKLDSLGFLSARHLMLEQKRVGQTAQHRAVLTFNEARQGLASWLAPPAPMGSLEFISPDAKVLAAFVFEDPVKMIDDVLAMTDDKDLSELRLFEERHGFSLRDDVAGALGGELAFAIDGPLLPEPAWKLVVEVYDPARLQYSIEQGLAELNTQLAQEGGAALELTEEESGGRTYYSLVTEHVDIHYIYAEGYLIAGPNRAHLDRAMRFKSSGYSIADEARFTSLLPQDGRNNFSALIYQDLGSLVQALAERMAQGELTEEQRQRIEGLKAGAKPSLGYAYGEPERIIIAASTEDDLLSKLLEQMVGLRNPVGLEQLFHELTQGM